MFAIQVKPGPLTRPYVGDEHIYEDELFLLARRLLEKRRKPAVMNHLGRCHACLESLIHVSWVVHELERNNYFPSTRQKLEGRV